MTDLNLKTDLLVKPTDFQSPELINVAKQAISAIRLQPTSLLLPPDSAVKNQQAFIKSATPNDLNAALLSLYVGTQALIVGGSNNQNDVDSLLQSAFGQDKNSLSIRDQLTKAFGPNVTIPDYLQGITKQFQSMIGDGIFRQWLMDGLKCVSTGGPPIMVQGKIVSVTMDKPCAGNKMVITVHGFYMEKNLKLSLPTISAKPDMDVAGADIIKGTNKIGNTTLTLTIPEDITSGDLYFYIASGQGPCKNFWSEMGFPEPVTFHIAAGPPVINLFASAQTGPVYPRQFIDLKWDVVNADNISIEMLTVPTSPANELPILRIPPKQISGELRVSISCTYRWQGQYILHASNACGMTTSAPIFLESDWSEFLVGSGVDDVTDSTPGLGMQGFADDLQKTIDVDADTRLFSRAFIIAKNKMNPTKSDYTALVIVDIWSCMQAIKTEVISRLSNVNGLNGIYNVENVLISGTHTHSGPGGYSHYFLYNLTADGFDLVNFNTIVTGIVNSIVEAHGNLAPGRIFINKGEVNNCGMNRSMGAYKKNINADLANNTDREMTLLKFVKYNNGHGNPYEIGVLNWYAIHPTSLGQSNTTISGDNKGWASHLFELDKKTNYTGVGPKPFIAAFANSNAGDVSGNMNSDGTAVSHDYIQDRIRMKDLGNKQYLKAKELFLSASEEITGDISFRYTYIQISNIALDNQPGVRTWPAAVGVSFGAGSTEDGKASIFVKGLGINIPSPVTEGVTNIVLTADDIAAIAKAVILFPVLAPVLPGLATAVTSGAGIPEAAQAFITLIQSLPALVSLPMLNALTSLIPVPLVSAIAFGGLQSLLKDQPLDAQPLAWKMPQLEPLNTDPAAINGSVFIAGQAPKPVMFPVGNCSPFPLVPNKVPIQLIKIGQLIIGGVPGEITTEAGRRLKSTLQSKFVNPLNKIVLATYANAYSGYITTKEEYNQQHYEGASTLYGPNTLEAYRQEFSKLAIAIINNTPNNTGFLDDVPFVRLKQRGIPAGIPYNMIYVNNRSGKPVIIRVFYTSVPDQSVSYNYPNESVPANENLLINVPTSAFLVNINGKPFTKPNGESIKGGDIITVP